ncbi:MAG: GNAT family N-acetyltransferase, partial [Bacteroidales bacterium]
YDTLSLCEELDRVKKDYELFTTRNYSILCAPTYIIPNIFREIGRLREITFREVGEGTNKGIDIDRYDFYYQHLFIWDNDEQRLVGAYRLGKGKDIISLYGIKGFYISSLFKIKKSFSTVLSQSIELGRSFIVKDYQKKVIPLFLLWKGIMIFLLKHSEYRYLIGPVSISNDLSKFSKSLLVEFIYKWFFNDEFARYIKPRKSFVPEPHKISDRTVIIDTSERDINKIESIIIDVEEGYRMPVLLKKYLEINGKIIGFNIDPKFNNCLDGLMILDVYEAPAEIVSGLSREMNDPLVFERFRVRRNDRNGES